MSVGQEKTRNLWKQEPGRDYRYATAAGNPSFIKAKVRAKLSCLYHIMPESGEPFTVLLTGREAWMLDLLIEAGARGGTPIEQPASNSMTLYFALFSNREAEV